MCNNYFFIKIRRSTNNKLTGGAWNKSKSNFGTSKEIFSFFFMMGLYVIADTNYRVQVQIRSYQVRACEKRGVLRE